ncbi:MAG: hypothetical protein ACRDH8_10210 [Actinomycetota bacterium]
MYDEAWFLRILDRLESGDVLYRDVWFSSTPLAVFGGMAFVSVFGTEVLALKAFVVLIFVLITLVSCRIDRQLGSRSRFHLFLILAFLVYALRSDAPTTQLAILFLLVAFSAALTWKARRVAAGDGATLAPVAPLVVGGAAAGLAFATKQNVGFLALSAFVLVLMVEAKGAGLRQRAAGLLAVALPFVLVIAAVSVPLLVSGGWDRFIYHGFHDQEIYLRVSSSVSYQQGLGMLWEILVTIRSPEQLRDLLAYAAYLFPIAAFAALLASRLVAGRDPQGRGRVVLFFVTAGFLAVFPIVDRGHLAYVTPVVFLGLAYGVRRLRPRLPTNLSRLAGGAAILVLAMILAYNLVAPLRRAASDAFHVSTLPHFRGALARSVDETRVRHEAQVLTEEIGTDRAFLLFTTPNVHYLVSGLDNPTPFDFPIAQVFGAKGQQEVIAAIEDGRIDVVCLAPQGGLLTPLESYVRRSMSPGLDVGTCTIYRSG